MSSELGALANKERKKAVPTIFQRRKDSHLIAQVKTKMADCNAFGVQQNLAAACPEEIKAYVQCATR